MSAENTTTTPDATVHLTAGHVAKFAAAYGDTVKAIVARVLVLNDALAYGVDVKTISADMAAEHRRNDAIPAVSEQTLGRAKFAITVADMIGTDIRAWAKRNPADVAAVVSAGKRGGLKPVASKLREALAPIDKSAHTAREEVVTGIIGDVLATILPEPAPSKPRQSKSAGDVESDGDAESIPAALAILASIRQATAWLASSEGEVSADLAAALAQLAKQATDTRKRARVALAGAKLVAAAA